MAVQDLARIEERLDKVTAGAVAVSDAIGGILFQNMAEVMEFAKLMSLASTAVPKHLRGNPGGCLAVTVQALEWRMSPFSVANKSYEVNDRIAYESQLIHAIIEARAPLKQRLRPFYDGDGVTRTCRIVGHIKGEVDPLDYTSPELGKIKVKNSPLWTSDPDQQLFYYASRAWARRHCPDVLLGIYAKDELEDSEIGPERARDITPAPDIGARLRGPKKGGGFQQQNVETQAVSLSAASNEEAKSNMKNAPQPIDVQPTEETVTEETAMQRGARLLPACTTERDIADLRATISDELPAEQQEAWAIACDARQSALKTAAGKGKK